MEGDAFTAERTGLRISLTLKMKMNILPYVQKPFHGIAICFFIYKIGEPMKKLFLLIGLLIFYVSLVHAQTTQTTPPPQTPPAATAPAQEPKTIDEALRWMEGNWEGTGKARGDHEFMGSLAVTSELDGNGILVNRGSMTMSGDPTGALKELMLIGYDGTTKKIVATMYDNKNIIAIYVGELGTNQIVFNLATAQPGYVSKRTFQLQPDGTLYFSIEGATPGNQPTKQVEINFKKK